MRELLAVCGATASGKSDCALWLCRALNGALVSCDSMQLYAGMDIGTAKPTIRERNETEHYMLDVLEPSQPCSAALYREMAKPIIESLFARKVQPILCGGTGLYVNALTKPMGFSVQGIGALRDMLSAIPKEQLHRMLAEIDPDSAARLHENDVRRVVRAIEIYRLTGHTQTEQAALDAQGEGDFPAVFFALDWPRSSLYDRIDRRVEIMMESGLVQEVRALLERGMGEGTAMQAIGYKEIARALRGEYSIDEALRRIRQATRNYAKRQLTWFRRDERIHWIRAEGRTADQIGQEILEIWEGEKE